jgi:hypothetical protein
MAMNKPKVRKRGDFIIAGTGDGSLCSLFVDAFDPPEYNGEDLDIFMHHTFYQRIKKTLLNKDYGDQHKLLKIPPDSGCELVVAIAGHIYGVDIYNPTDGHSMDTYGMIAIDEVSTPYTTGCGGEHAKGAIDALMSEGVADTKYIAKKALEVAAKNSPGCGDGWDWVIE